MANIEITNNKTSGLVIYDPVYDADTINAEDAATWETGTILARVTTTGKLAAYTPGNSDGTQLPVAILPYDIEVPESEDIRVEVLIQGQVRRSDLIIHDITTPRELTKAELDLLRTYGILARTTTQLSNQDNQ